ncbi:MAG: crossover junction endodeoxyribonuclease RuvC [Deltaproteobacteria bacterium]|nr:crossover junction endodeoxyribonuclease RuvC [Deltaproteobacteria bacterium]
MRVLGIDPGTLVMGWGIVEKGPSGRLIRVGDGEIRANPKDPLAERLLKMSNSLKKVISEFRPSSAAVESVFFARNVKSAITLGHARGVAMLSAVESGMTVSEYSPSSIKQAVTGYGGATKDQVQKMVMAILKTAVLARPDAADALAIAICHINTASFSASASAPRGPLSRPRRIKGVAF